MESERISGVDELDAVRLKLQSQVDTMMETRSKLLVLSSEKKNLDSSIKELEFSTAYDVKKDTSFKNDTERKAEINSRLNNHADYIKWGNRIREVDTELRILECNEANLRYEQRAFIAIKDILICKIQIGGK